jgi:acyl dehydratase
LTTAAAEDLPGGGTAHHGMLIMSVASAIVILALIGGLVLTYLSFYTAPREQKLYILTS